MVFLYLTVILGVLTYYSARRFDRRFEAFAATIATLLEDDGFVITADSPAALCRSKILFIDTYTRKYLPYSIKKIHEGRTTTVFLVLSGRNFTTHWNGVRMCVVVEGFECEQLKLEINSQPFRTYLEQQRKALPGIHNSEFQKKYLLRGRDGGLQHPVSPAMTKKMLELHPANFEAFATGILLYKDVAISQANKVLYLVNEAEWLYQQIADAVKEEGSVPRGKA